MTQSPLVIEELHDPNEVRSGGARETRIYYRPHLKPAVKDDKGKIIEPEEQIWIATTPLPADPWHMNHYAKKGFKLWPPGQEPAAGEVVALQAQISELEQQAEALKEATAVDEAARVEIGTEVKRLEESANNLKKAIEVGEVVAKPNAISCPVENCSFIAKKYLGLARHMKQVHKIQ